MKDDIANPFVLISLIIAVLTTCIFVKYYFVNPIVKEPVKIEVLASEKDDLELLTIAYLKQNQDLRIGAFNSINNNKYAVAANYYYLKKGIDYLDKYDQILEEGKKIFADKKINFSNFVVNIDACGKEKYSTLEGKIYNTDCDSSEIVYEISNIYKQKDYYIVEFYATKADQKAVDQKVDCEKPLKEASYTLILTDFDSKNFYNETFSKCCANCKLEGIYPLKDTILSKVKSNHLIYRMIFKKNGQSFVYYDIKK